MAFLIFCFGILTGSFLNVCIFRIPRNITIAKGRSRCVSCGRHLQPWDLVPVLSYLFLRGKCRYCREPIGSQYPLVELLTGILFMAAYWVFGFSWILLFHLTLISLLIIAAFTDLEFGIIPDGIVVFGILSAVVMNAAGIGRPLLDGFYGLLAGGGSLLLVASLTLLFFRQEGMGGGDIKLMGMIGVFLGLRMTLLALLLSIFIGGFSGALLIILKLKTRKSAIPFGPFISLGTLLAIFYGEELLSWYLMKI